ncbi:peptidase S8 [Alkalihalobacillus alcalophilus ATCC 27647 = CGMCC 1.3604]|uniref:Peptidase S8 n=1 Tax=Alkalihalobacillus alcalophilus ATCC 27647 = CGMCC 1.3604 TaxID=1218173 RepID=A0A4S4JT92_ALKAL|nr:peptidase S8 [Alkalihalobacillus alcalophilus ATCC 27647 = CGMCC 1.3604]
MIFLKRVVAICLFMLMVIMPLCSQGHTYAQEAVVQSQQTKALTEVSGKANNSTATAHETTKSNLATGALTNHATSLIDIPQVDINVSSTQSPTELKRPIFSDDEEDLDRKEIVIVTAKGDMNELIEQIKAEVPEATIRKIFTRLYNGFTMELPKRELTKLEKMEDIERIDRLAYFEANIESSVPFIGAGPTKDLMSRNGTQLTGKGVKVAVIDTGIDYRHPDLQVNYQGGYDVVDDDEDPMETIASQGIPTLHGTHVAGIIAANGTLKGVAPEAELYVYRALGPGGQGTTEQVIEAIEKAVDDGVDIINLSLGNTVNGPDWPTSIALDKAVEAGVVAVTSNGNSGPKMWTVGSPGTSSKAISVGASAPPIQTPYVTIFGEDKELTLLPMGGTLPWNLKRDFSVIDAGYGTKEEFDEIEAKGKIAIIKRGLVPFNEKVIAAYNAGAEAVIIYNNLSGSFVGAIEGGVKLPAVSISKEDGEWLLQKMKKNKKDLNIRTIYRKEQDFIAPFSSRGPVTHSWEVKPDLVAPGVSINSTIPKGYLSLNGTSMSSPHVAGAAALILEAHPDWTPEQVKAALMNTSKKLYNNENDPYFPHEQGAGRIQVDKAVSAKTLVYPGAMTFGKWSKDDLRETRTISFTIDNQDDVTRTYHVVPPFDVPDGVQWKVPYAVTIAAGEKKEIELAVDLMPSVLAEGLHHGDIFIEGGKEKVAVPFVFFIEEPDYPRLMSFHFGHGDKEESYRYELYLPGGAEEVGIAVYNPDTFQFITYLDVQYDLGRGMVGGEIHDIGLEDGVYKALVYAKQEGREDTLEAWITIGAEIPPKSQGAEVN